MDKRFNSLSYSGDFVPKRSGEVRINKALELIGTGKRVLDIGCFDGTIMQRIKDAGNAVTGVEVADGAIKKAREKGFKVYDLSLAQAWAKQIKERFEVVFAGEIIEHIFDTDKLLQNIRLVLVKDGILVLTTPNIASLGRRIYLLLGKNPLIETTARQYDSGHIRYFTFATLSKLLAENRFRTEKTESTLVNFDVEGRISSIMLAKLFPTLGSTIVLRAIKT